MRTVLLVAAAAVLSACGGTPAADDADDVPAPAGGADSELTIAYESGDGPPVDHRWSLVCGEGVAAGSHPDPDGACAHLRADEALLDPLSDDLVCTEQYGGPQTARVTGGWRDEVEVDLQLSRVDGCRIAQWDALGPLLPPAG